MKYMYGLICIVLISIGILFGRFFLSRLPFHIPGLPYCPDCNIVLVSVDTLRADELPCYGYSRDTAPNLCSFAKKNILLSNFYSESSLTLDSHMSIFTGLYPSTHHILNLLADTLNPDIPTLTQVLQKNGYRTIWAGVTDDPELPLDKGLGRGFMEIHALDGRSPEWPAEYEKILGELRDGKPIFLFLHTYWVHAPYLAGHGPRRYMNLPALEIPLTDDEFYVNSFPFYQWALDLYRKGLETSSTPQSRNHDQAIINALSSALARNDLSGARSAFSKLSGYEAGGAFISWYWKEVDPQDPRSMPFVQGLYDERINQLDDALKPLLDFVSRPDVKRKTIFILTADHGEEFMEHGFVEHDNNLYKTVTHIPFILSIPHIPSGLRNGLAQSIDIYPTILDLLGIKPMARLEGNSLVPLLANPSGQPGDQYLVSERRGGSFNISIQDGRYRLYLNTPQSEAIWPTELYDLLVDPNETDNIYGAHPDVVARLSKALSDILKRSPRYVPMESQFPVWIDDQKRENLIKHGYF